MNNINNRVPNSHLQAHEGTVNGITLIEFSPVPHEVSFTNDSATGTLKFRVSDEDQTLNYNWATLRPNETITLQISTRFIELSGSNVEYRVWGLG